MIPTSIPLPTENAQDGVDLQNTFVQEERRKERVEGNVKNNVKQSEKQDQGLERPTNPLQGLSRFEEFRILQPSAALKVNFQQEVNVIRFTKESFAICVKNGEVNADKSQYYNQLEDPGQYADAFHLHFLEFMGEKGSNYMRVTRSHALEQYNLNLYQQDDDALLHPELGALRPDKRVNEFTIEHSDSDWYYQNDLDIDR